jgi:hypothetical protein
MVLPDPVRHTAVLQRKERVLLSITMQLLVSLVSLSADQKLGSTTQLWQDCDSVICCALFPGIAAITLSILLAFRRCPRYRREVNAKIKTCSQQQMEVTQNAFCVQVDISVVVLEV